MSISNTTKLYIEAVQKAAIGFKEFEKGLKTISKFDLRSKPTTLIVSDTIYKHKEEIEESYRKVGNNVCLVKGNLFI